MALKATIYKAELQVSDLDRQYYGSHALTIALHPSETEERLMVRLLAFVLFADEALSFTRGLSSDDEPDLWRKNLSDEIELWIEIGQPDERRIRKACARARQVVVFSYGGRSADIWWQGIGRALERFDNLRVLNLPAGQAGQLLALLERSMRLQCTVDGGTAWLSSEAASVEASPVVWKHG